RSDDVRDRPPHQRRRWRRDLEPAHLRETVEVERVEAHRPPVLELRLERIAYLGERRPPDDVEPERGADHVADRARLELPGGAVERRHELPAARRGEIAAPRLRAGIVGVALRELGEGGAVPRGGPTTNTA